MKHLKTDPDVFEDVLQGRKTFEIRFNDRGYAVGDVLVLRQTKHSGEEMAQGARLEYTGRILVVRVKHLIVGPSYGIMHGWVCMSIELLYFTRVIENDEAEIERLLRGGCCKLGF